VKKIQRNGNSSIIADKEISNLQNESRKMAVQKMSSVNIPEAAT